MVLLPLCHGAFLASVLLVLLSEARGDCGPPKTLLNSKLRQDPQQSYPVGTRLTYTCDPGYESSSGRPPSSECLGTSKWSEISGSCRGRRCPTPNIENGRIAEETDLLFGVEITFVCDEGYRAIGQNGAKCTFQNNIVNWDHVPPHCERIPCLPPPAIANGNHNGQDNYVYGSAVTYKCDGQLSLIGNRTIVCTFGQDLNGKWSGSAPECKEVSCRAPDVPNGVMITGYQPSYTYQDRIMFRCKSGFKLKNNRGDTSCGADNRWQPSLPECVLDIRPTDSSGGDGENTSAGSSSQSPVGSTVKPVEETTKTEIGTKAPELPADEPGSSISVAVGVGAAVAVIAVVAIIVAALKYRARHKRQGKTITGSAPESYTAVPHNTDISLEEKA